ncbi:MAG TPA: DNA adenine methylase [Candidatus Paceibacterota bacterium]|nr:DNA adenine methylase [Candidatus Paceibacterota bacterium]HMO83008.1 DNA adenine methylase [Candidatus Paceibacterota bacterium]
MKTLRTKQVKPFLKWVGGKGQLLNQFENLYPENYNRYFEPFVGGGAVYFSLAPRQAHINDINQTLVQTYRNIKSDVEKLISELAILEQDYLAKNTDARKVMYYDIRTKYNELEPDAFERSIYFLFFNKTAFNGVYRENSKGGFNVPIGSYTNPKIVDEDNLRLVAQTLKKTTITNQSYFDAVSKAKSGDFVYFDPPYHPLSETSSFTSYSKDSFSKDDQINLRDLFIELDKRGVYVMLSNSSAPFIQEIYSGFNQIPVFASRMINSKADKRGKISEVVVLNYEPQQNREIASEIALSTFPQYQYR